MWKLQSAMPPGSLMHPENKRYIYDVSVSSYRYRCRKGFPQSGKSFLLTRSYDYRSVHKKKRPQGGVQWENDGANCRADFII